MKLLRLLTSSIFLLTATLTMIVLFLLIQHMRITADFGESEQIPALLKQVRIDFDSSGTIHIESGSERDAIIAAGYCAAAGHLWEMERVRMAATGRLAENYGGDYLDADLVHRGLRFDSLAISFYDRLPTNTREWLNWYVAGINAFIETKRYNADIRFQLHGIEPRSWHPSDPVLFQRFLAWYTASGWREAYLVNHLKAVLPEAQAATLPDDDNGLDSSGQIAVLDKFWKVYRQLREFFGQYPTPSAASYMNDINRLNRGARIVAANSWSGELPVNRQKLHIVAPEMEVAGLTVPGIPGIQQGRSRDSAWAWFWLTNQAFSFRHARLSEDLSRLYIDSTAVKVDVERVRLAIRDSRPVNWVRHSTEAGIVLNPSLQQEYYADTYWLRWAGLNYTDEFTLLRKLMTETGREELSPLLQRLAYPARLLLYDADHEAGLAAVQSTNINREAIDALLSENVEISLAPKKTWVMPPYLNLPAAHPIVGVDGIERQKQLQDWTVENLFAEFLAENQITAYDNLPIGDLPSKLFAWLRLVNDDAMNSAHPQGEEVLFMLRRWEDEPSDNPVANLVLTVWKAQLIKIILMEHLDAEWQLKLSETPQFFVPWLRKIYRRENGLQSSVLAKQLTDEEGFLTEAFSRALKLITATIGSDIADWDLKSFLNSKLDPAFRNLMVYEMTSGLSSSPLRRKIGGTDVIENLPGKSWEIGSWTSWGGFREEGLRILRRRSLRHSGPEHALSPFLVPVSDEKWRPVLFATRVKGLFHIYLKP